MIQKYLRGLKVIQNYHRIVFERQLVDLEAFDVKNKVTRGVCANLIRNACKIYLRRKLKKRLVAEAAAAELAAAEAAKKKKKGKKDGDAKKKKKGKKKKGDGAKKGKGKKKKAGNNEDLATELSEPVGGDGQPEDGQEDDPEGDDDEKDDDPEEVGPGDDNLAAAEDESPSLPRRVIKVKSDGSAQEEEGEDE